MRRAFALFLVFMLLAASASATVLPPEGISAGYLSFTGIEAYRAVVLCENLSVCDERDGSVIDKLYFGDTFMTGESWDGWAKCSYADGSKTGWVRSDYIVIDPAYYLTDAQTAVYSYGYTMAPRVALLDGGTKLPIIAEMEDWYVVSLRGASGWIGKTPADTVNETWFRPEMLSSIVQADLVAGEKRYALHDVEKLEQLSALLCSTDDLGGPVAGCPFGAQLILRLDENAQKQFQISQVTLELATDSCCVYRVDGRDYQYARSMKTEDSSPSNELIFNLFDGTLTFDFSK